jgi:hypothetical protein
MEKRWLRYIGRGSLKNRKIIWLTLSIIVLQSCTTLKRHSFNKSNDLVQDDYFYTEKIVSNNHEFKKNNSNEIKQFIDSNFITNVLDSLQIIPTKQGFKTTPKKLLLKLKDANKLGPEIRKRKENYVNDTWGIIAFISVLASAAFWFTSHLIFNSIHGILGVLGLISFAMIFVALYLSHRRKRHQREMFKNKGFDIATWVILALATIALAIAMYIILDILFFP